jgi:hypothetical protein
MYLARLINLKNEVNNSYNFILETMYVYVAKHSINKSSLVALKSRGYNNRID